MLVGQLPMSEQGQTFVSRRLERQLKFSRYEV